MALESISVAGCRPPVEGVWLLARAGGGVCLSLFVPRLVRGRGRAPLWAQEGLERAFWDLAKALPLRPWVLITGELAEWAETKGIAPCATEARADAARAFGAGGQGDWGGQSVRGAALSGAPPGAAGVAPAPVGLGPQLRGTAGTIGKQRRGRRAPSEERPRSSLELGGQSAISATTRTHEAAGTVTHP